MPPFNGSGSFSVYTPGNPAVTGTTISSTAFNNTMNDFASGLSNAMTRDGQSPATSNIPMGNNRITGLANGTARTDAATVAQIQDGGPTYLTSVSGTNTITASLTGLAAYTAGQSFRFVSAGANTGAVTININGLGAKAITKNGTTALASGDIPSGALIVVSYDGTQFQLFMGASGSYAQAGANSDITSLNGLTTPISLVALRSYLSGLTMSTAGASAIMSIAAGMAMDSTNAYPLTLASSINKTTSAWAVGTGNGGLDTGVIANSTWYHFYLIRRPDTGVVDVLFSLSASSPTLPTNYTQFRRIGSGRTNGSGQWTKFYQSGDTFWWDTTVFDVGANNPGTAAVTRTLTVPTGVEVEAIFNGGVENAGSAVSGGAYFSSLFVSDQGPSATTAPLWSSGGLYSNAAGGVRNTYTQNRVLTNTSAQIRTRLSASDASITLYMATLGWVDSRGRNA